MDYQKTRQEALGEQEALIKRREEIDQEKKRLELERSQTERRLVGLKQVLAGLEIMTTDPPVAAPPPPQPPPRVVETPHFAKAERKELPFPIRLVANLVVRRERRDLPEPKPKVQPAPNGDSLLKPEWETAPPAPVHVETRTDKREWLG